MNGWEVVVGLETHAQLSTVSKIFSGASTRFGAAPNTQACDIDIALPGVLPSFNRGAVERAIRFGLAVGATINARSVFARKNYFYPDLPKGYQISQYERPVVEGGTVAVIMPDGREKIVRLTRAHLEEDAGKSLHEDFHGMSGIDLNRAGTPLLEIVSEPDLRSAEEAVAYAKTLHTLLRWLEVCDGNMQEGSFRCDANVSVRRMGSEKLGTRCEIKNLNSFRFLEKAIQYEAARQVELIESGSAVVQQTRLFDSDRGETRPMRSKEDAHDYRYFPDPDLPPLSLDEAWIARARSLLPELPQARRIRFAEQYGLSAYDAAILTAERELAQYYEDVVEALGGAAEGAKLAANWIMGELLAALNRDQLDITRSPLSAAQLAALLTRLRQGRISGRVAKAKFEELWRLASTSAAPADDFPAALAWLDSAIASQGLEQISDAAAIESIAAAVLEANPQSVAEYRSGKPKAFNSLVGQVMKATAGKANPALVSDILKRRLNG